MAGRGRPKGLGRTPGSGRKPGTPNKANRDLIELANTLGVNPFEVLLHFTAGNWKALGYPADGYVSGDSYRFYVTPESRLKAASEASQYLYPKRKQIEVLPDQSQSAKAIQKKSFESFCEASGYPKPFPKQSEMRTFAFESDDTRIILGARGVGKTDYLTILGVAYDIYLDPINASNLVLTDSKTRNTAIIQEIESALTKNGVELLTSNSTVIRTKDRQGKDHSVEILTVRSSLRGRHPRRILFDDPVTEEDVSEAKRSLVFRKYGEAYKLCKNICIIGQPAHRHDLYSKLRPILKVMEVPHGTIPELDHDIEAMRLAGIDEASIQMSYHLKVPQDGSNPFDNIKSIDRFPPGDSVAFIDPSHEGGDFTAISIVRQWMEGVAVVGFMWKKSWNHCLDDIAPLLPKYGVRRLAFETNALGDMPIDILRRSFPNVGIVGRRTVTNKHSRIMAAGAYAHMIHISKDSHKAYTDQVVQYEFNAKHDDGPDSLASCLEWIGLVRGKG